MSNYQTTSAKPIPANPQLERYARYPFRTMAVGESFDFPTTEYKRVYSAAMMYGKRNSLQFLVRSNRDGTCTCWRKA